MLAEILRDVATVDGSLGALPIGGVSADSRSVRRGDLFVAVPGARADGHAFLAAAAQAGAAAALVEREVPGAPLPCVRVPSTATALAAVSAAFHGDPSSKLCVVGVTGTNGKTTVTYLLDAILAAAGHRALVIGSIHYRLGDRVLRSGLTTPFPHELQEVMAEGVSAGATHLVMEVSSHSAAQGRIAGVRFDAGLFTNLSHDHLDFHGDMESYFRAKERFFREFLPAGGKRTGMAVNADDPYGGRLAREFPGALAFGFAEGHPVRPLSAALTLEGMRISLSTPEGPLDLASGLIGRHNVANVMTAVCGAILLGIPREAVAEGVRRLAAIPGRMERIPNRRGFHVFVDYAHTPDGLARVLAGLREISPGRLVTVFGCGGNRDRAKRPEMGRAAARLSDVVIATSDNPRNEDPLAILGEIVPGIAEEGLVAADGGAAGRGFYEVIPDRRSAIGRALALARPGDTILVAGKGHENVQIVGDRSLPFDDREVVRAALASGG